MQVVKYCTELIEDKDLEKLDLIIKYMKRQVLHSLACSSSSFSFSVIAYVVCWMFSLQTHAAVSGVCLEYGFRFHRRQRASGCAAGLW